MKTEHISEHDEQAALDHNQTSPEAVIGLQDVHHRPHGRSQDLVHGEHGGIAANFVVGSNASVLYTKVL